MVVDIESHADTLVFIELNVCTKINSVTLSPWTSAPGQLHTAKL